MTSLASVTAAETLRAAPRGFTEDQWRTFLRDGLVSIPGALKAQEVAQYLSVTQECLDR